MRSRAFFTRWTVALCGLLPAATSCARRPFCRPAATSTASIHSASPAPTQFRMARGRRSDCWNVTWAMAIAFPESIALVLWGTDNLKSEGGPIAQALALMGARPRFDSYGRLAGADLIALEQLGRPRVDVIITLSGIFRDLLPLQVKLLAEASFLAASADEPLERNFVRKHALAYQLEHGWRSGNCVALRVFGNAEGAYGSNVNHLVDNSRWDDEDELAETYTRRKCFAYGRSAGPCSRPRCCKSVLADVRARLPESRFGRTRRDDVDKYFDTLGGISRAVTRAKGGAEVAPVYIGDQHAWRRAPCARSPSRSRSRRARACSTPSGTRACSSTVTKACVRSRCTLPTRWAGPRRPVRCSRGSTSSSRRRSCSTPRCASVSRRSIRPRRREGREPTARGARAQLLAARCERARGAASRRRGAGRSARRCIRRRRQHDNTTVPMSTLKTRGRRAGWRG